jgi:hypothetical protein
MNTSRNPMNEDELKAIDQRLAAMSERCDAVIAKEKPLGKRMPILDFKPRSRPVSQAVSQPSPKARYVPPEEPDIESFDRHYTPVPEHRLMAITEWQEGSIEQIFADFERQFDEMAQAHRYR